MISDHTQRLNAPLKKSKNPHLKAEGGESNLAPSLNMLQLFLQFSGEKLRISKPVNGKLTGSILWQKVQNGTVAQSYQRNIGIRIRLKRVQN